MKKILLSVLLISALMISMTLVSVVSAAAVVNSGGLSNTILAGQFNNRHLSLNGGTRNGYEVALGTNTGTAAKVNADFNYVGRWLASNHVKLVYDSNTNTMYSTSTANNVYSLQYLANASVTGKNYLQFQVSGRATFNTLPTTRVQFNNVVLTTPLGGTESLGNFDSGINAQTFWNVQGISLDNGFTLEGDLVLMDLVSGCNPATSGQCDGCDECSKVQIDFGKYVPPCTPSTEVCDGKDNDCDGSVDEGITSTPTTCGVGGCAANGVLACVNGAMVDNCAPGTPTTETCNQIDDDCNGVVDNGCPLIDKQSTLAALQGVTLVDKSAQKYLTEAIDHLVKSLDPVNWINSEELSCKEKDPKADGKKVLEEEKKAVEKLMNVQKKEPTQTVADAIIAITNIDRKIAAKAIELNPNCNKINDAVNKLAAGDEKYADGKYHEAVAQYREAWQKAVYCVCKEDTGITGFAIVGSDGALCNWFGWFC
jgi:hypothetical protein